MLGEEAEGGSKDGCGGAKGGGELGRSNRKQQRCWWVKIRCQGLVGSGPVLAKVYNPTGCCKHRAEIWVAAAGQANTFSTNCILLCCEFQEDERSSGKAGRWSCEGIETCGANKSIWPVGV